MLDAAGYTDADGDGGREYKGKPIELRLIARSESTEEQQMGKLIAGWFDDVGIEVKLEVMDSSTLTSTILDYEGRTSSRPTTTCSSGAGTSTTIPARC